MITRPATLLAPAWRVRAFAAAVLLVALSTGATWLVHGETVDYGFNYDDYHTVRPYTRQEVITTFHSQWDPRGDVMVPFYRPLTISFHALRFELFGLNSRAHHLMSLGLFAVAAALAGWLVFRLTRRVSAAVIATFLYVAHPALPYSAVAWITNQMHLLQTLVVLGALIWWDIVRARDGAWWWPLLLFGTVSFLIKEDGVMLLPVIVMLHIIRRHMTERDLPPVSLRFVAAAGLLVVALMGVRFLALGGLGGYGAFSWAAAWTRVSGALYGVYRLIPADREWQPLASVFATWLPLLSVAAWRWISTAARLCLASGAVIAVMFALPFMFVAKAEQAYLIALGMSLLLTGASIAMFDLAGRTPAPRVAGVAAAAALGVGLASLVAVTRDISRDFAPFAPIVLSNDDIVRTWWTVPPELRDYLARKRDADARDRVPANPVDDLPHVSFGFLGPEVNSAGEPYLWMTGPRVEIDVAARVRQVTIPIRHQIEAFREASRALVVADGRPVDDIRFDSSEWRMVIIGLPPEHATRVGRMHRISITIDHAWKPSEVIPGSTDERVLGLQVGTLQTR